MASYYTKYNSARTKEFKLTKEGKLITPHGVLAYPRLAEMSAPTGSTNPPAYSTKFLFPSDCKFDVFLAEVQKAQVKAGARSPGESVFKIASWDLFDKDNLDAELAAQTKEKFSLGISARNQFSRDVREPRRGELAPVENYASAVYGGRWAQLQLSVRSYAGKAGKSGVNFILDGVVLGFHDTPCFTVGGASLNESAFDVQQFEDEPAADDAFAGLL